MTETNAQHVAVIMDGNGRWAQSRGKPRRAGHREGVKVAREAIEFFARQDVRYLTLFAFSSENWQRPETEVSALMELFVNVLRREAAQLRKNGIRLRVIGERARFPEAVQSAMREAEQLTRDADKFDVLIAANYGGRWDIVQAAAALAEEVRRGEISPAEIDQSSIAKHLVTHDVPDPDLMIRTGGESRISNFLIWQSAYTELYFSERLWPDMSEDDFAAALSAFAKRERRFGQTGAQVSKASC